jgi:uncharacterized protein YjbI with pentapeptide repeats
VGTLFRGANLSGINFSSTYAGGSFQNADFTGANLTGTRFDMTLGSSSSMQNALFVGANLTNAYFGASVDLTLANMQNATTTGATSAVPNGKWAYARCPNSTVLGATPTAGCL